MTWVSSAVADFLLNVASSTLGFLAGLGLFGIGREIARRRRR